MRKLLYSSLVLLAAGCMTAHEVRASTIVDISASAPTVSLGDALTVDVDITGAVDLYGFQFDLSFNPAVVTAGAATEGGLLPSGGTTFFIAGTTDNTGGVVAANADTLIAAIPGVNGNGTLVSFAFTALAPGTSTFSLSNVELLDSALNPIDETNVSGSVTVSAVPLPESSGLLATGLVALAIVFVWARRPAGGGMRSVP